MFHPIGEFTKFLCEPVTCFNLELCEPSRFAVGQQWYEAFQFNRGFLRVTRLFHQQMFKLPNSLIVIHLRYSLPLGLP